MCVAMLFQVRIEIIRCEAKSTSCQTSLTFGTGPHHPVLPDFGCLAISLEGS